MNNFYNPFFHHRFPCYTYYPFNMPNKQISKNCTGINLLENTEKKQDAKHTINTVQKSEQAILEFHGIKLFSDDLLILLIIYFLYKQNINDPFLYVVLFALLFA